LAQLTPVKSIRTGRFSARARLSVLIEAAEVGGEDPREEALDERVARLLAEEDRRQQKRQAQEQRPGDHPAGPDLHRVVVVVGAEQPQQVDAADQGQHDPDRQQRLRVEPGVLGD
jgi:hypothetical protein